jgi:predicted lipid-binding transport protein (Tim44 family)
MVQRVSVIWAFQTQPKSFSGLTFDEMRNELASGLFNQTVLAQRLSPPPPPWISEWLAGLLLFLGALFSIGALFSPGWTIIGLILIGLLVAVAFWYMKQQAPKTRAKYQADLAQYIKAKERWDNLYYCSRDDGVFLPGPGAQLIPIGYMRDFLYQP